MEPASGLRLDRASIEHSENGWLLPAGEARYSRKIGSVARVKSGGYGLGPPDQLTL